MEPLHSSVLQGSRSSALKLYLEKEKILRKVKVLQELDVKQEYMPRPARVKFEPRSSIEVKQLEEFKELKEESAVKTMEYHSHVKSVCTRTIKMETLINRKKFTVIFIKELCKIGKGFANMQLSLANFDEYTIALDANTSNHIKEYLVKSYLLDPSDKIKKYLSLTSKEIQEIAMKELGKNEHVEDLQHLEEDGEELLMPVNPYSKFMRQDKIQKLFDSQNDNSENQKKIISVTNEIKENFIKVANIVSFMYYNNTKKIERSELSHAAFLGRYKSAEIENITKATAKAVSSEPKMPPSTVEKLARETAKLQVDKQLKNLDSEKGKLLQLISQAKAHLNQCKQLAKSTSKASPKRKNVSFKECENNHDKYEKEYDAD